ncbi:hypothetical protein BV20DRAFT_958983, partial [Pilatotrama ljubarskyi]
SNVVQMMIPTCDRELIDPEYLDHWIATIQGPILTRCEATEDQRWMLLHLALAYRAFVQGWPSLNQDDYYHFIARLVEAAMSLQPDERADDHIEELVEWLRAGLPEVRLYITRDMITGV